MDEDTKTPMERARADVKDCVSRCYPSVYTSSGVTLVGRVDELEALLRDMREALDGLAVRIVDLRNQDREISRVG